MKCGHCGDEHDLIDPAFRRPHAIVELPEDVRKRRAAESDDFCALRGDTGKPERFFLRCTFSVDLLDSTPGDLVMWGLWAELSEADFKTVAALWKEPDQAKTAPFPGTLANRVPGYAETRGLPVVVRLTGLTSRPALTFSPDCHHGFVDECRAGVKVHRVHEWLSSRTPTKR